MLQHPKSSNGARVIRHQSIKSKGFFSKYEFLHYPRPVATCQLSDPLSKSNDILHVYVLVQTICMNDFLIIFMAIKNRKNYHEHFRLQTEKKNHQYYSSHIAQSFKLRNFPVYNLCIYQVWCTFDQVWSLLKMAKISCK